MPAAIDELAGGARFVEISGEQLNLFDTDVLVWLVDNDAQREQIRANPVYARLTVATERRDLLPNRAQPALPPGRLVPMLAAAIDGHPATEVTS